MNFTCRCEIQSVLGYCESRLGICDEANGGKGKEIGRTACSVG